MNIGSVGYRYSSDEMAALLALTGTGSLPGIHGDFAPTGDIERGLFSLEEAALLSQTNEEYRLEQIPDFLIRQSAECSAWLTIQWSGRMISVRFAKKTCILIERTRDSAWLLTPFPDVPSARNGYEFSLDALDFTDPKVFLCPAAQGISPEIASKSTALALFDRVAAL